MLRGNWRFFGQWPKDWRGCLVYIAATFYWPPSELYSLDDEELMFWYDAAQDINRSQRSGKKF